MNLEQTIDAIVPHLLERSKDLPASTTENYRAACFPVDELADKTGTSAAMLGKIRQRFRSALAQAMTPGQDPKFQVLAQSYFGRSAIAVRRLYD